MRYRALVTMRDGIAHVRFPTCYNCRTEAGPGEDVRERAAKALAAWLEPQLTRNAVPFPPRLPRGQLPGHSWWLDVPVPTVLALRIELRAARLRQRLTQRDLAEMLGVTQQQVALYEAGAANPSLSSLIAVADALYHDLEITLPPRPSGCPHASDRLSRPASVRARGPAT
jgi:DNA-binding XRE family transcriptional regulator